MTTTKLHNYDVFPQNGRPQPPIRSALGDLIKCPVTPRTGLKIRRIVRAINQQIEDIDAERLKIVELYGEGDGEERAVNETGVAAWHELMWLTFEVEQIEVEEIEGLKEIRALTLIDLGDLLADEATKTPAEAG